MTTDSPLWRQIFAETFARLWKENRRAPAYVAHLAADVADEAIDELAVRAQIEARRRAG